MRRMLQRSFFPILILIVLVGYVALANEIVNKRHATPEVIYPEYYDQKGIEYVPNEVIVGFWRMPSSLDEFATKHGGKLIDNHGNDSGYDVLKFAAFKTDDMAGFIKNVSTDPYVRYVQPEQIGHAGIPANESASG